MARVKLSKKHIIQAIETEPLRLLAPRNWISGHWPKTLEASKEDCTVCAVGSVLRNTLSDSGRPHRVSRVAELNVNLNFAVGALSEGVVSKAEIFKCGKELVKASPLTALSFVFETLCANAETRTYAGISRHQMRRIRKNVVEFVQKHFPRSIEIDVKRYATAPRLERI